MNKFGRNYILNVQANRLVTPSLSQSFIEIKPPFTLEFSIMRNELSSANYSTFRIYNLSELTRNQLLQDQYDPNGLLVNLQAGYGSGPSFPIIFSGVATRSTSVREGNNFISQIEAFDGGNVFTSAIIDPPLQFPAGTAYKTIITALLNSLKQYGVQPGVIGDFPGTTSRGYPVSGNTINAIIDLVGQNGFFIDNGVANCLNTNEVIAPQGGVIQIINSDSGLLGTPVREETLLTFDILFEPRLTIGQVIQLQSVTGANYNAQYKVASVSHKGIISNSVCGEAITTVTVFYQKSLTQVTR